jgi:hypothetical protein
MAREDTKNEVAPAAAAVKPDFALTVIHPFGDYQRGAQITDAAEIDAVLASENARHCHKVAPQ